MALRLSAMALSALQVKAGYPSVRDAMTAGSGQGRHSFYFYRHVDVPHWAAFQARLRTPQLVMVFDMSRVLSDCTQQSVACRQTMRGTCQAACAFVSGAASCLESRAGHLADARQRRPQVFRGVPFLYELKALLDWSVTPTTLTLVDWLKLEDIRASLYNRECDLLMRGLGRAEGEPQPVLSKLLLGFGLFLAVLALLWTPLLAFSSSNPTFRIPRVTDFAFNASLSHAAAAGGAHGTVVAMRLPVFSSAARYSVQPWLRRRPRAALPTSLVAYSPAQLQLLCGGEDSDAVWQPAPAVRGAFEHMLRHEARAGAPYRPSAVWLELSFSVLRSFPPPTAYGGPECAGGVRVRLSRASAGSIAAVMAGGAPWAQLQGWLEGTESVDTSPKAGLFAWVWQLKEHKCAVQSSWGATAASPKSSLLGTQLDDWSEFEVRAGCIGDCVAGACPEHAAGCRVQGTTWSWR
jgi:Piezo non-specific cation channel, R-Ras-binding domain